MSHCYVDARVRHDVFEPHAREPTSVKVTCTLPHGTFDVARCILRATVNCILRARRRVCCERAIMRAGCNCGAPTLRLMQYARRCCRGFCTPATCDLDRSYRAYWRARSRGSGRLSRFRADPRHRPTSRAALSPQLDTRAPGIRARSHTASQRDDFVSNRWCECVWSSRLGSSERSGTCADLRIAAAKRGMSGTHREVRIPE